VTGAHTGIVYVYINMHVNICGKTQCVTVQLTDRNVPGDSLCVLIAKEQQ